jgi:hypothetical protein
LHLLKKGLADYQINPASLSIRGGHRERLLGMTLQYDHDYDQRLYNASQRAITEFNAGGPMSPAGRWKQVASSVASAMLRNLPPDMIFTCAKISFAMRLFGT